MPGHQDPECVFARSPGVDTSNRPVPSRYNGSQLTARAASHARDPRIRRYGPSRSGALSRGDACRPPKRSAVTGAVLPRSVSDRISSSTSRVPPLKARDKQRTDRNQRRGSGDSPLDRTIAFVWIDPNDHFDPVGPGQGQGKAENSNERQEHLDPESVTGTPYSVHHRSPVPYLAVGEPRGNPGMAALRLVCLVGRI